MLFSRYVKEILFRENYFKLPNDIIDYIYKIIMQHVQESTVSYNGVLIFDINKAVKTRSYSDVFIEEGRNGHKSFVFRYALPSYNHPTNQEMSVSVYIEYDSILPPKNTNISRGEHSRSQKIVVVRIPCVTIVDNNKFVDSLYSSFEQKTFTSANINLIQQEFTKSVALVKNKYFSYMKQFSTYDAIAQTVEHEFIHVADPAQYQVPLTDTETLQAQHDQYNKDYFGTPYAKSGRIPAEFNSFFWNIIRNFSVPLEEKTKKSLLEFIRNPRPLIKAFKMFNVRTLNVGKIAQHIFKYLNEKDPDYLSFVRTLNTYHYRSFLIRIFQDPYLTKKFLQKLYKFVTEH